MSPRDRFQHDVATGRWSLPVVALITLAVWMLTAQRPLADGGALLCAGVTAYLLAELNTRFMLIRARTALPSCIFLCLFAATPFLFQWSTGCLLPVFFTCMLFALFRSYDSYRASATIFHAFLFLGLGSIVFPCLFWLSPLMFLHMVFLRSFSAKTFFAGIIGLLIPYWLILGYSLCTGNYDRFPDMMAAPFRWEAPDYGSVGLPFVAAWGASLLLFVAFVAFYSVSAYKDKVQTRILLKTIAWMGVWLQALMAVHPQGAHLLLPVFFIPTAILGGRLYALTFGLYVRISFYTSLALIFFLFLFGLWMHLFNS